MNRSGSLVPRKGGSVTSDTMRIYVPARKEVLVVTHNQFHIVKTKISYGFSRAFRLSCECTVLHGLLTCHGSSIKCMAGNIFT